MQNQEIETLEIKISDDNSSKASKFSYSKLNTYESCPWKYKLKYIDQHFINEDSLAADFGTLCHYIDEQIGKNIINNNGSIDNLDIDFNYYIDMFINGDTDHFGIKSLKDKYKNKFDLPDKYNETFSDKANNYLNIGIYLLYDILNNNKGLKVIGTEIPFNVKYKNYIFHGYIDRLLFDENTETYIIQDLKTWTNISNHSLTTPLQFVFYVQAIQEMYNVSIDNIKCQYVLPLTGEIFDAGTKGFIKRGLNKIDKLLDKIEIEDFKPNPSPLCHWCIFSNTYPDQPDESKNLCPYYCNWTKEKKDFSVNYEWAGIENHNKILEAFISENSKSISPSILENIDIYINKEDRFYLLRRS